MKTNKSLVIGITLYLTGCGSVFGHKSSDVGPKTLKKADISFRAHIDAVTGVAFVGGQTAVSVSYDGAIKTWNLQSGEKKLEISIPNAQFADLALASSGNQVVTSNMIPAYGSDGTPGPSVQSWNLLDGTPAKSFASNQYPDARGLAVTTDGTKVAAGETARTLAIWDFTSGSLLGRTTADAAGAVLAVAFSPNGELVAAAHERNLVVRKTAGLAETLRVDLEGQAVSVAYAGSGKYIAIATGYPNKIAVYDAGSGKLLRVLAQYGLESPLFAQIRFSHASGSEDVLATGYGKTVSFWNVGTGAEVLRVETADDVYSMELKDRLIVGGRNNISVWTVNL